MATSQTQHTTPKDAPDLGLHDPLVDSFPAGFEGRLLFWIAVAFSAFQIATAAHLVDLPSQIVRAIHVGFLALLGFPLIALLRGKRACRSSPPPGRWRSPASRWRSINGGNMRR